MVRTSRERERESTVYVDDVESIMSTYLVCRYIPYV